MADRTYEAMAAGRRQAGEVIKYRQDRLRARRAALERAAPRERLVTAKVRGDLAADLAPVSSGMLIAEGDSWFDYPWTDILSELEDRHGFEVESVSHRGDRIEAMAYQGGQLEKFVRTLEKLIRRGTIPDAILLSGGGNDVAGEEFAVLLNHAESPAPGLNDDVVEGVLERIRLSYITVLCAVASVCEDHLGVALPVLVHGYDYSVPDGRGFWGGWGPLPGPWLEPGFRQKGYDSDTQRLGIVRDLIDRFNTILSQLPQVSGLGHVRPVDLRGTLSTGGDYREWWANELHPTARGFESVAQKFVDAI